VDDDKFGQLLDALPRIAEAVNQFQSPTVQEHAFLALVRALGIAESPVDASCQSALSGLPAIDFSLPGLQSLLDFAGEKNPKNKYEQNLLAVYYLEHILGLQDITTDHVRAAYKECNWREPTSLLHSLQNTASQKSWIITRHMHDIRTTPAGTTTVEQEMPYPSHATGRQLSDVETSSSARRSRRACEASGNLADDLVEATQDPGFRRCGQQDKDVARYLVG
jgi:hypothetical protein